MSIRVECHSCGTVLKAKDSSAGKRAKCPNCGEILEIPEPVYDAEEAVDDYGVEDDDGADEYGADDYDDSFDFGGADVNQGTPVARRKPCPACGEMIVASAAKCRYCGEIFDPALKRRAGKKSHVAEDEDLQTAEWVLAILCSGIGCIVGIVWMIQGKPKGAKMVGVSIAAAVAWNLLSFLLQMMAEMA